MMTDQNNQSRNLHGYLALETFRNEQFTFEYPLGGAVVPIEHAGQVTSWQVWVNIAGEQYFCTVESAPPGVPPQAQAEERFGHAHPAFATEDCVPYRMLESAEEAWRTRTRFVDGGRAPLVIDAAWVGGRNGEVYLVQYAAAPERCKIARPVFDTLILTFRIFSV